MIKYNENLKTTSSIGESVYSVMQGETKIMPRHTRLDNSIGYVERQLESLSIYIEGLRGNFNGPVKDDLLKREKCYAEVMQEAPNRLDGITKRIAELRESLNDIIG